MDNNIIQEESLPAKENQQKYSSKAIKIKIHIKTAVIIAIIIVLGALAYMYKGVFVAATVDGSPISRLAVIRKLESTAGKNVLDSFINEKLVQNEARAKNISVSDDEINNQIKTIEDQIKSQGSTLEAALATANMTIDDLKKQILIQKEIEKLIADKISVTDEEALQYIADNKIPVPAGQEAALAGQIKNELQNQKLDTEAKALIDALRLKAKIKRFVNY